MDNFLQSEMWMAFEEAVGSKTLSLEGEGFQGRGIVHTLPFVGKYIYFPRGPVRRISNDQFSIFKLCGELERVAKEKNAKWVRIEPRTEEELGEYKKSFGGTLVRAPHDMQPREILVVGLEGSEETLLQKMKSKTRYNIRLAEKKSVKVFATRDKKYEEAFLELMTRTATRKEITPHPESHYAHFFSSLPPENLFLFVAEYEGAVLAANLVLLFGDTATYLHGGSSDLYRETMAPYLLQWEQIRFAKDKGMKYYDFGGVTTQSTTYNLQPTTSWSGITRFKQGFAPETAPLLFPGSYDIVLEKKAYFLYHQLSRLRGILLSLRKSLKI